MRVITGRFKGRKLRPVGGANVRSTADRVKESLFNILAAEVPGADVLDLFCGAGTLGIEALSRGAHRAMFVDSVRSSVNRTRDNLAMIGALDEAELLMSDALKALRTLTHQGLTYSLIFADPPYDCGWSVRIVNAVAASAVCAPAGILVLEHHKKEPPGEPPAGFSLWTERRFGDTMLTIWRWRQSRQPYDPEGAEND